MTRKALIVVAVILLAAGFVSGLRLAPGRGGAVVVEVPAPAHEVKEGEPDTDRSIGDRVRTAERAPAAVTVARGAAADDVEAFCGAAGFTAVARAADKDEHADPAVLPSEPVPMPAADAGPLFLRSYMLRGDRLTNWGVRPDGALVRFEHDNIHDPSVTVDGGSVHVESWRWWWVEPVLKGAACTYLGVEAGNRIPDPWAAYTVAGAGCLAISWGF